MDRTLRPQARDVGRSSLLRFAGLARALNVLGGRHVRTIHRSVHRHLVDGARARAQHGSRQELPNKMRLPRDSYLIAQRLYRGWQFAAVLVVAALASTFVMMRFPPIMTAQIARS